MEAVINPKIVSGIFKAYVSNSSVELAYLPALIRGVHAALQRLAIGKSTQPVIASKLVPAVPIKR